jgi:prepilin-type N-terminal cleavage/methylation domain-containing protein
MILRQNIFLRQGFTLIELLVVIAIIALLSSIVFASLNSARMKSRNARRLSEMSQIKLALEMYFDDFGYYPTDNDGGACNCDYSTLPTSAPDFLPSLQTAYLPTVMLDPLNINTGNIHYGYYSQDGSTYYLMFNMEPNGNGQDCPPHAPMDSGIPGQGGAKWCTIRP